MSAITYIAHSRAPLMPGHLADNQYSFEIPCKSFDRMVKAPAKQHKSLGGAIETVLEGVNTDLSIQLGSFPESMQGQIDEFYYSVSAGESWQFDLNGTVSTPDNPINVIMMSRNMNLTRFTRTRFIVNFMMRVE